MGGYSRPRGAAQTNKRASLLLRPPPDTYRLGEKVRRGRDVRGIRSVPPLRWAGLPPGSFLQGLFRYARRGTGYSLYVDARNWITSNDRKWPYSFLNLCDILHLAADAIRAELLGNTSGHPSLKSRTT